MIGGFSGETGHAGCPVELVDAMLGFPLLMQAVWGSELILLISPSFLLSTSSQVVTVVKAFLQINN